jgi:hypothetical protein
MGLNVDVPNVIGRNNYLDLIDASRSFFIEMII